MTLTIKLDGNWSSFQLANSTPPLSVTDSAIAPSARIPTRKCIFNNVVFIMCGSLSYLVVVIVKQFSGYYPLLYCYPKGCAATSEVRCQCNTWGIPSKLGDTPPQRKIDVTSKSPVGDISVVTLIRTDTTLDHSQKAEKVWSCKPVMSRHSFCDFF